MTSHQTPPPSHNKHQSGNEMGVPDQDFFDVGDEAEEFFDADEVEDIDNGTSFASKDKGQAEQCGRWLLSLPRNDVTALQGTPEFAEFLQSFARLRQVHSTCQPSTPIGGNSVDSGNSESFSFLQQGAVDELVIRVMEYLECKALMQISMTCSRFRALANLSAAQRTRDISKARQLGSVMKLLRAREELVGGANSDPTSLHVPVPMLCLPKRLLVTNATDQEYNGVYVCTGCNPNGFMFQKPRNVDLDLLDMINDRSWTRSQLVHDRFVDQEQVHQNGLKCTIAKRFSHQTLLWYMSKEVATTTSTEGQLEISEVFSYWTKLVGKEGMAPDIGMYPSPTSLLTQNGDPGWLTLSPNRRDVPPIVELLD